MPRRQLSVPSFAGLQNRNVVVDTRRTSMRLEPEMWEALHDISRREGVTVNEICTRVEKARVESSLSSAMRVTILCYFRHLALAPNPNGPLLAAVLNELQDEPEQRQRQSRRLSS